MRTVIDAATQRCKKAVPVAVGTDFAYKAMSAHRTGSRSIARPQNDFWSIHKDKR